jgi:hypothetical protein
MKEGNFTEGVMLDLGLLADPANISFFADSMTFETGRYGVAPLS